MDLMPAFSRIKEIWPQNRLPLILGVLGLTLFVLGLIWSFDPFSQKDEFEFLPSESAVEASSSAKIIVDVSGEVISPGVYSLEPNARMQDVITAAGGFSENADTEWVAKSLNLAAKITDGAKVYIPKVGEVSNVLQVSKGESGTLGVQTGLININIASSSELDKLPGIGVVTAQKIIDGRPYSSIDELLSKKIVGKKVFEDIKDKITTY